MNATIKEMLMLYRDTSLVQSYIYCDDINSKLKDGIPIDETVFFVLLEDIVNINYGLHFLGNREKENISLILNKKLLKSLEEKDNEMVEKCNSMIIKNNMSRIDNSECALIGLMCLTSVSEKRVKRQFINGKIDIEEFREFFQCAYEFS